VSLHARWFFCRRYFTPSRRWHRKERARPAHHVKEALGVLRVTIFVGTLGNDQAEAIAFARPLLTDLEDIALQNFDLPPVVAQTILHNAAPATEQRRFALATHNTLLKIPLGAILSLPDAILDRKYKRFLVARLVGQA